MEKKKEKLIKRLRNKYRLVIMNEQTFEEKASFTLTRLNLFIALSSLVVFCIFLGVSLIVFTPIKEYVLGEDDVEIRKKMVAQSLRVDSLEQELRMKDKFIDVLQNAINGDFDTTHPVKPAKRDTTLGANVNEKPSEVEMALRTEVEVGDKYSLMVNSKDAPRKEGISNFYFFSPVKGFITDHFTTDNDHYAIDVVTKPNETVKSTLDGTVIIASWTPETGHVIVVQHSNNMISIYKHNAVLLKKVGNIVKAGDAIAIVGNSGELSTGPHLHFELWYNGIAVNPEGYMVF